MDRRPITRGQAACVLCQTCANWSPLPEQECRARARTRDAWSCEHYVRDFRPMRWYDRRRLPRDGPDRRGSAR